MAFAIILTVLLALPAAICFTRGSSLYYNSITRQGSFSIDFEHDTFIKDGEPFRYISGSMHYVRIPSYYWLDRLQKARAAGLNAVQVYVMWNVHEPKPGSYEFRGQYDLERFIRLAQQVGLLVILRAGPYICGEWEYGGFPAWLLRNYDDINVRTMDPRYLKPVDRWLSVLLPRMRKLLYTNGGPIIMVQVENEYGSYPACDHNYMRHLRDTFRTHLGNSTLLFTTDGSGERYLKCGAVEGVYATVDFGAGNVTAGFAPMRKWNPKGPLVNSEFYSGWLDTWGHPHSRTSTATVVKSLEQIIRIGANVNMYMFEGGTNFGFMNGAVSAGQLVTTSYDYDAPLSEAGDITSKYLAIRDLIHKYVKQPLIPVPPSTPKFAYGKVVMNYASSLLQAVQFSKAKPKYSSYPLSMEQIGQNYGFILYHHQLQQAVHDSLLQVDGIRDSGYVFIDDHVVGWLQRKTNTSLRLTARKGSTVSILVENEGRTNFGAAMRDNRKGIISNVTLNNQPLVGWQIHSLNLTELFSLNKRVHKDRKLDIFRPSSSKATLKPVSPDELFELNVSKGSLKESLAKGHMQRPSYGGLFRPAGFVGHFHLPDFPGFPQDSFLRMDNWGKGQVILNGVNLGRYWPAASQPQITLYVPAGALLPAPYVNTLLMFELRGVPSTLVVEFVDGPVFKSTVDVAKWGRERQR